MRIIKETKLPIGLKPGALTIGNFDGLHLGHQSVLNDLKKFAGENDRMVLTFTNSPSEILNPQSPSPRLCTLDHKIKLFEKQGIDALILLTFTKELSNQTAEEFLRKIRIKYPFRHLVLGHDAVFGKNRQGNPEEIKSLADKFQFHVHYTPPFLIDGTVVSSSLLRKLIQEGNLIEAEKFLGRRYSLYCRVVKKKQKGFTASIDTKKLCLPPPGIYDIWIGYQKKLLDGIANLKLNQPTNQEKIHILEIQLLDDAINIDKKKIEIFFREKPIIFFAK